MMSDRLQAIKDRAARAQSNPDYESGNSIMHALADIPALVKVVEAALEYMRGVSVVTLTDEALFNAVQAFERGE